ncbi:MAG: dethiobiotin synthase [Actinomycetota bacterium]|nr:dethiobiotin synthase [Actinomycetota bacterium]
MRGVFVTATDTDVGKTMLAAAICVALSARGQRVAAHKPVVTGTAEPEQGVPPDHVLLAMCTGQRPEEVAPHAFGPAVSPHLAAAGAPLDPAALEAAARAAAPPGGVLVVEGVGGLLVPLDDQGYDVRALARALGLPVVIAARPGLGTINHTLLTIEAAWSAGLDVRGVVLTPWPDVPTALERSNAATIASLGHVTVNHLPRATALTPAALAAAGARLPVDRWIGAAAAPD